MKNLKIILAVLLLLSIFSCRKSATSLNNKSSVTKPATHFVNIVILGNSITYTAENSQAGWLNSCGMAASTPDSDYVHLLARKFQSANPNARITIRNTIPFEADCASYDLNANLADLKNLKPDLLILRMGEDVPVGYDTVQFEQKYVALMNYFKDDNPNLVILSGGSVWSGSIVAGVMARHPPYVSLQMFDNADFSYGLFANVGISQHPSDKGMRVIANTLWNKILTL
jgi:hypothetical protein